MPLNYVDYQITLQTLWLVNTGMLIGAIGMFAIYQFFHSRQSDTAPLFPALIGLLLLNLGIGYISQELGHIKPLALRVDYPDGLVGLCGAVMGIPIAWKRFYHSNTPHKASTE